MYCKPYKQCNKSHITQYYSDSHKAIDFAYTYGTWLVAPEKCKVVKIVDNLDIDKDTEGLRNGYGVKLQSVAEPNIFHIYWHCLPVFPVAEGDVVEQGENVAQMGNSGLVYWGGQYVEVGDRLIPPYKGTHLHWEAYKLGDEREYFDYLGQIDWNLEVQDLQITLIEKIINKIKSIL